MGWGRDGRGETDLSYQFGIFKHVMVSENDKEICIEDKVKLSNIYIGDKHFLKQIIPAWL